MVLDRTDSLPSVHKTTQCEQLCSSNEREESLVISCWRILATGEGINSQLEWKTGRWPVFRFSRAEFAPHSNDEDQIQTIYENDNALTVKLLLRRRVSKQNVSVFCTDRFILPTWASLTICALYNQAILVEGHRLLYFTRQHQKIISFDLAPKFLVFRRIHGLNIK